MSKKYLAIIGGVLVLGGVLAAWFWGEHPAEEGISEEIAKEVGVMTVGEEDSKRATLEKTVLFTSESAAFAVAQYSGIVEEVSFEVGQVVKKGEVIAKFDQSYQENGPRLALGSAWENHQIAQDNLERTKEVAEKSVELAENGVEIAEAQLKQAKKRYDDDPTYQNKKAVDIAEENLENAEDLEDQAEEQAEINLNSARMALNQQNLSLGQARISYNHTLVTAPIAGTIASKGDQISAGDYINAGTVVAQIVGEGQLEAVFTLNQFQAARVVVGDQVEFVIAGERFPAKVESKAPIASQDNQRYQVKVVSTVNLARKANQTGQVRLSLRVDAGQPGRFFLPIEAVSIGQRKTEVFVIGEGRAVTREIQTGELVGKQIEVTSGLEAREQVVVENARNIKDGDLVSF